MATSAGVGQGSTFTARLPLSDNDISAETSPAPLVFSIQTNAGAKRRLLVVDDNVDAAVGLAALLELGGHDTLIAHELAHLQRYDPAWFAFVEIIAALSAFQPFIFRVAAAFRRDVELICDEAAVHRTNDRHSLIGALALLAAPFDPRATIHGAATAYDGSPLVARAARIASLSDSSRERRSRRAAIGAVLGLSGALCMAPVVTSVPSLDDFAAELASAKRLGRLEKHVVLADTSVTERRVRMKMLIRQ